MTNRFQPNSQTVPIRDADRPKSRSFVLIGFMGVGKTTIGKLCADRLGCRFCDTDSMVEARMGRPIAEVFENMGEAEFRRLEKEAIAEAALFENVVIATGGGAPLHPANQVSLKAVGPIVLLTADANTISNRIGDPASRPLLASATDTIAQIKSLMLSRRRAYAAIADLSVSVADREPSEIVEDITGWINSASTRETEVIRASTRLEVNTGGLGYSIWLGNGLIKYGGGSIIAAAVGKTKACIVTHPNLKHEYAEPLSYEMIRLGIDTSIVLLPQGESRKNLKTVERLYSAFVAAGLDRNCIVIAVGGGVIGDIAGFAAASYLRGVRCIQVPTTLLAQVDSSVGGKTGVDLPEGKNLVGAFHQPTVVLIDPLALKTLPLRELRSGLAEVIKYGIITDRAFFYQTRDDLPELLNRDSEALKRAIMRSCEIKAAVVSEDEKEHGVRATLNFGHTVGHALESVTQYKRYRHGEAISIGMVSACLIGEELGITLRNVTQEVTACLTSCGLPVHFPDFVDFESVHAAMMLDKKTQAGRLRFVIAEHIGKVRIVDGVETDVIDRALVRQKPS